MCHDENEKEKKSSKKNYDHSVYSNKIRSAEQRNEDKTKKTNKRIKFPLSDRT